VNTSLPGLLRRDAVAAGFGFFAAVSGDGTVFRGAAAGGCLYEEESGGFGCGSGPALAFVRRLKSGRLAAKSGFPGFSRVQIGFVFLALFFCFQLLLGFVSLVFIFDVFLGHRNDCFS